MGYSPFSIVEDFNQERKLEGWWSFVYPKLFYFNKQVDFIFSYPNKIYLTTSNEFICLTLVETRKSKIITWLIIDLLSYFFFILLRLFSNYTRRVFEQQKLLRQNSKGKWVSFK